MNTHKITPSQVAGWHLVKGLGREFESAALRWFARALVEATARCQREPIGGTARALYLEADLTSGHCRGLETAFLVVLKDGRRFAGIAPTARSADARAKRLLRHGRCFAAGFF